MTTSQLSMLTELDETLATSTSSAAGFPAKTSRLRAVARAWMANARAYGRKCGVFLATSVHGTQSWRTRQDCLIADWTAFSETWPRSGMMLSGIAYQLPPLAPLTSETAFGLLPTIVASDGEAARKLTARTRAGSYRTSTGSWRYRSSSGAQSSNLMLTRSLVSELEFLTNETLGPHTLEPRFAERMMGFPESWTDLGPSETPSSRSSRS